MAEVWTAFVVGGAEEMELLRAMSASDVVSRNRGAQHEANDTKYSAYSDGGRMRATIRRTATISASPVTFTFAAAATSRAVVVARAGRLRLAWLTATRRSSGRSRPRRRRSAWKRRGWR